MTYHSTKVIYVQRDIHERSYTDTNYICRYIFFQTKNMKLIQINLNCNRFNYRKRIYYNTYNRVISRKMQEINQSHSNVRKIIDYDW